MISRTSRNTYNHSSNSYRNQSNLRSSSSLAQKRNYNTFQEDPQKAVFLSGFRTNIPEYRWKEYREAIYQDLQKYYGVYIRKLDLPVNHRFGYLHTKTVEQAETLLNLRNEQDSETGKILSQLDLARNTRFNNWRTKIYVYEYERKNDGRHHHNMGSRNHSSERNLNVRENSRKRDRSYNAGYDSPQSVRSYQNYSEGPRSRNDNSTSTNGFISDDFSRSMSPLDSENNTGRKAPYQTPQVENNQIPKCSNFNNNQNNLTVNKDSALQSHNVTEPGSEDENIENILLKNRSKSTSTKTVIATEINSKNLESLELDQQILNYENESDADMNFSSDDSDKIMKDSENFQNNNIDITNNQPSLNLNNLTSQQNLQNLNQNQVNFQEVAEQTRNKIIYEGLKNNWLESYNSLSNHVQQSLMLNYHDACWTYGLEYAAQQLSIQGCLAIFLKDQGVQTL